jgi:hypothetical protein
MKLFDRIIGALCLLGLILAIVTGIRNGWEYFWGWMAVVAVVAFIGSIAWRIHKSKERGAWIDRQIDKEKRQQQATNCLPRSRALRLARMLLWWSTTTGVPTMKINHREWTIDSVPEQKGPLWYPWVEVQRGPWEHHDGQIFHFTDLGYYDTENAAKPRGVDWAKAWLNSNF